MGLNRDLFDRTAAAFDEAVPFFGPLGALLAEHARVAPGEKVVDLGAGKGAVTAGLRHLTPAGSVTAVDVSPAMVAAVRRLALPDVAVVEADVARLPFPDGSFDGATSGFTLHILEDAERAGAEIRRVLRPGATLTWSMPGTHPDAEEWQEAYGDVYAEFTGRLDDPPAEMVPGPPPHELLERAGLALVDEVQVPFVVPVGGPEAYWAWTQTHGARWLTDTLPAKDAEELRAAVVDSLVRLHPDGGRSIMVAPRFFRMRRD